MPKKGQPISQEHRDAISRARKGVKASDETRAKQRAAHLGKSNDAWKGRHHTEEAKEKNRLAHLGKSRGNTYARGYKHTPEARSKIGAAMKALWEQRRADPTLTPTIPMHPERQLGYTGQVPRGRWTVRQMREWKDSQCAFCGVTENLELDHIVARVLGGMNTRDNCQTLCQACNQWKLEHIDKPQYMALQANKGAK